MNVVSESASLRNLSDSEVAEIVARACPVESCRGKRVLLIVPDSTRTAPVGLMFKTLHRQVASVTHAFDVLVALGTHPPMREKAICERLEISPAERQGEFADIHLFNHEWDNPGALKKIGVIPAKDISELTGGLFAMDVSVEINKLIFNYDKVIIIGPVFPHEVVGFSGGNKYLFPGIGGPKILNFFHWLGAVCTNPMIIGNKWTPVRKVVDRAGAMVNVEKLCFAMVVAPDGSSDALSPLALPHHPVDHPGEGGRGGRGPKNILVGLFAGTPESAWDEASELSKQIHITRKPKPFKTVLSCAPPMYDEIWVAGKCMYKLEPVVADGGELIIYAPHVHEISVTHGKLIAEIGYHCRDYFLKQWDKFKHYPWGVLAHSTHVRGIGTYENGVEKCRVQVTLATGIPEAVCKKIYLGYRDPKSIQPEDFANREGEGVLLVPKAGEMLYHLEHQPKWAGG